MKFTRILLFFAILFLGTSLFAQTPTAMQYQLLVLNPKTGLVRTKADVEVLLELRQTSSDGKSVWSQDFSETTDAQGFCLLTLDFKNSVDWSKGPYFLSVTIDGEPCGVSQLTSVPYAFKAAKAAELDGVLTAKELVGKWTWMKKSDYLRTYIYVFNEDHTGYFETSSDWEHRKMTFTWKINAVGLLFVDGVTTSSTSYGSTDTYSTLGLWDTFKISDTEIIINEDDDDDALRLIKQ